jgi:hypothetical protein
MAARIHRTLEVIAFNANDILRQRYELSKQLQDLHTDLVLLSETHLKPHERFLIPNYHFYRTDCFPGRRGIPHTHVICAVRTLNKRSSIFIRDKVIYLSQRTLHKE